MPYGYYFDKTYFLVLIGVVLSLLASGLVKSTFAKYSKVRSMSGITGKDAAKHILQMQGIHDVRVEHISGNLTDHYDPSAKILRLSDSVYNSASVAAIGVAAHECGHAIQHAKGYLPLSIRGTLVPAANFGSAISWPLIIAGLFLGGGSSILVIIGIFAFTLAVLFQIVTLPVEFNASSRAAKILENSGMLAGQEVKGMKKVLGAAALTYVASAASAILQLLRLILISRTNDRD